MGIRRLAVSVTGLAAALALLAVSAGAAAAAPGAHGTRVIHATHWDTSQPLRDTPPAPPQHEGIKIEHRRKDIPRTFSGPFDPVVQTTAPASAAPTLQSSFEGIGLGDGYAVNSAPPDPNGAVGPNDYVEVVNEDFAVFNKSGSLIYGPVPTNTLWSGFGGGCQSNNDGDATVKYDQMADRWIISQFSVSTTPYLQCVAVSTTGDPTGSWNRFSFGGFGSNFPDYPKLGVWPDAYYTTFNLFYLGAFFVGPQVCAYDRSTMLKVPAQQATQQCASPGSAYGSMLPSDLDGSTLPPSGSPDFLVTLDTNSLDLFKFHVDWATPSNSTLSGATNIPVASYSEACGGGTCIPQGGVSQQLDSLGDRLMYRLAYRNFGDHESLVVAHSVTAGSSVGVRWYELRNPNGTPTVYQQGTYAPDSNYRWMPSIAMDHSGDIAMGYSISSSTAHPGIDYTGRLAGDPLGQMTQGEGNVLTGAGSQNGGLSRWGDYTSMAIDPSDDCTFWYTNQYLSATGSFNWSTRIGTFKLPGCSTSATPGFSLAASPSSQTVSQGQGTSYTVTETPSGGYSGTVGYSVSGLPTGAGATFNPATTSGSTLSTAMTISTASTTPAGTYQLTITGTDTTTSTITSSTNVTLVVTAPDFSLSATPASQTVTAGQGTSYTVTETPSNGYGGTVGYSASGAPAGVNVSFTPTTTGPGALSTTMTVTTSTSTAPGTYTLTITGTDTSNSSLSHQTSVTLVVAQDFSLSASPSSLTIHRGSSGKYTVSITNASGGAYGGPAVSLSVSGLPNRANASFSPNPATTSSTLTVSVNRKSPTGSFTLTITGKAGGFTHTTTVGLTVS